MREAGWLHSAGRSIATDLDPLIVTSAVQRSGTTLLQRVLCSSPETLIYGERAAQDLEFFIKMHAYKVQEYGMLRQSAQQEMNQVLSGDVNHWIFDLTPDVDGYLQAMREATFAGATYCRDFARTKGRPVWGFKYPAWSPDFLKSLHKVMPKSRVLFIVRDLMPALKSAKAQHMVSSEQQLREFCQSWSNGLAYCQELEGDSSALVVRYEEILEDPEWMLDTIGEFSGARQIKRSVLERKVNTWMGQGFASQLSDGYIPPAPLTEMELKIVEEVTAGGGVLVSG
jgi:hypothetical protein